MEKPQNEIIELQTLDQRYMSSCHPQKNHPFKEEVAAWKDSLRKSAILGQKRGVPVSQISRAFPRIAKLHREGFFQNRSVRDYFEGLDLDGHNMRLYLFLKNVARQKYPEALRPAIIKAIFEHINDCSVKIAHVLNNDLPSYRDEEHPSFDGSLLDKSLSSPFVFVHGRSSSGHTIIRETDGETYLKFKDFFERRKQKIQKRPFYLGAEI